MSWFSFEWKLFFNVSCLEAYRGLGSPHTNLIYDLCHVFYVILMIANLLSAKTMLRRQKLESGKAPRKPCVEQSRQRPGSGNRRLSHHSQVHACSCPVGRKTMNNCKRSVNGCVWTCWIGCADPFMLCPSVSKTE